jgi:hypothetical protein
MKEKQLDFEDFAIRQAMENQLPKESSPSKASRLLNVWKKLGRRPTIQTGNSEKHLSAPSSGTSSK